MSVTPTRSVRGRSVSSLSDRSSPSSEVELCVDPSAAPSTDPSAALYVSAIGPSGTRAWFRVSGSGGGLPSVVTVTGAGPHAIPANTDVVYASPNGGTCVLALVASSSQTAGRPLRVVQVNDGVVTYTCPSPVLAGTSLYELAHAGDSIELLPDASAWRLVSSIGAPRDFDVYVNNATGNDLAVGGVSSPLATLQEALRRAAITSWRRNGTIRLAAGSTYSFGSTFTVPGGVANGATPLLIQGEDEVVVASATVSAWTPGSNSAGTPSVLSVAGAPFAVNALRGYVVEMIGSGARFGVFSNTTNTLVLTAFSVVSPPAPGDTFRIVRGPAIVDVVTLMSPSTGSIVSLQNVRVFVFNLIAEGVQANVREVMMSSNGTFFENGSALFNRLGGGYTILFYPYTLPSVVFTAGDTNLTRWGLTNTSVQSFSRNSVFSSQCITQGSSRWRSDQFVEHSALHCVDAALAAGTHYLHANAGTIFVRNSTLNNITGDTPCVASDGGNMTAQNIAGTGNAPVCWATRSAGRIRLVSPGVGVSMSGGASPVQVGSNAPTSYGNIATGLAAFTTDIANASSQLCRVGE